MSPIGVSEWTLGIVFASGLVVFGINSGIYAIRSMIRIIDAVFAWVYPRWPSETELVGSNLVNFIVKSMDRVIDVKFGLRWRRWGLEGELIGSESFALFLTLSFVSPIFTAALFIFALDLTAKFIDQFRLDRTPFDVTFGFVMIAFTIGIWLEMLRIDPIVKKMIALERLSSAHRSRFSVIELLSMYESLRHAPQRFWRVYAEIPDAELNDETNRKFREMAAPFRHSQLMSVNKALVAAALLTVLVGGITILVSVI